MKNTLLLAFAVSCAGSLTTFDSALALPSFFENKLEIYSCRSHAEAIACNVCTKDNEIQVVFKVNVNSQVVLQQQYQKAKLVGSDSFDSCKIANDKNWDCSNYETLPSGGYKSTSKRMNDGIYSNIYERISYGDKRFNLPTYETKTYWCAK